MNRDRALAYAAFFVVCTVWGTTYLAIRVAIESLPTFLFAGFRFVLGGAILLGLCAMRGDPIPRAWRVWRDISIVGVLMVGVGNVAVVWAERYVPSGIAALLVATSPFWMAILEYLRRNRGLLTARRKAGMVIGFAGVAILVSPAIHGTEVNALFLAGVLVLQLGSIAWNIGSIRSKYHPIAASTLVSAAMQMLTGGIAVTLIGLAHGELTRFVFTPRTFVAFSYLVIFGSVLAYSAYAYALAKLPTSTVSLYAYVNPAIAVLLGWAILDEPLGWRAALSMLVIFAGVALVQTAPPPAPTAEPA